MFDYSNNTNSQIDSNLDTWNIYNNKVVSFRNNYIKNNSDNMLPVAYSFCTHVIKFLWNYVDKQSVFKLRKCVVSTIELDRDIIKLTKDIAYFLSKLSIVECSYYIGTLYTLLLPNKYKSDLGIFYTPPILAERLLDMLASEGANWSRNTILDPACGGGAFLVPVANRILGDHRIKCLSPLEKLVYLENHLSGIEIDKFAGWLTQVLLDILIYPETVAANRTIKNIIKVSDTIQYALGPNHIKYDLIIGNPPYGRIKLNDNVRLAYKRSLFGHANMYGLFIDAALHMKTKKGLIGFVTPTSFLGGEYFKNLRKLLIKEAPPLSINFISERSGVFQEVLQETCLTVYGINESKNISLHEIEVCESEYKVNKIGSFKLNLNDKPWIIPRKISEAALLNVISNNTSYISDYGYKVSTGPLVWNRHKEQLRTKYAKGSFPIIWSEAIVDGEFNLNYKQRKNKYITVNNDQAYLLCKQSVALVQRTTSKEQHKRILTTVIPQNIIDKYKCVVIENHVNYIYPVNSQIISLKALSLLLNTNIVDRIFRCISGSVAVSVSELNVLPLPDIDKVTEIDSLITMYEYAKIDKETLINKIESIATHAYGIEV